MKNLKRLTLIGLLSLAPVFAACGDDHGHDHGDGHNHDHDQNGHHHDHGKLHYHKMATVTLGGTNFDVMQSGHPNDSKMNFELRGAGAGKLKLTAWVEDGDGKVVSQKVEAHKHGDDGTHLENLRMPRRTPEKLLLCFEGEGIEKHSIPILMTHEEAEKHEAESK